MGALSVLLVALALQARPGPADVAVRTSVDHAAVEVGEPFVLTLEVEHPADATPSLGDEVELPLGDHFAVIDRDLAVSRPTLDERRLTTTRRFTIVALAPVEVLPAFDVAFTSPWSAAVGESEEDAEDDGTFTVSTTELPLVAATVLGETEFHRPLKGFRDELPEVPVERVPWWIAAVGAPVVLLLLALVVRRLSRRAAPAPPPRTPMERLESLEGSVSEDLAALQSMHYSLTTILREATDERLGEVRAAATDGEWFDSVRSDERLAPDVRDALERVLERAEAVKYARQRPTRWSVEETLDAAKAVLEGVTNGRAS